MGLMGKTLFIFFYLIWLPNREVLHQCSDYTPAIDFVLSLFIFCCFASETVICLKSWKMKSNSIPMSGGVQLLNYFSVWIHRSPKMSALQTNVVICQAFYHAHFSKLESIPNEILLLRGPSGEIWRFQLSVSLFIVSSSCSFQVTFCLSLLSLVSLFDHHASFSVTSLRLFFVSTFFLCRLHLENPYNHWYMSGPAY